MSPSCSRSTEVRFLDDDEVVVIGVESVDEKISLGGVRFVNV